jgi:DNA-binding CsgD family transcriptional regulator
VRALRLVPTRRRREAMDALDDSATNLATLGFAGLAAETRLEWAELAAERGEASARDAVLALVPYFDTQGLDDWGDRARRLARTIGVRIGGRRGGVGELTRRESEVVELVVAGLSNAEIASRLFLSERTVETHLQHVYRRLGVESRLTLVQRWSTGADGQLRSEGAAP